jgi:protein involved in polysaccharide export with SLBB domain
MRRRTISALFAVLAWLTSWGGFALAQDRNAPPPQSAVGTSSGAGFEYHLGAGDKLRIIVFGEESLTGEFFVSGGGKIAFPLIGDIDVVGLTIPELQAAIAAKLADGYLKQPRVSAEVLNYRPFYILGEVMKPGEYP